MSLEIRAVRAVTPLTTSGLATGTGNGSAGLACLLNVRLPGSPELPIWERLFGFVQLKISENKSFFVIAEKGLFTRPKLHYASLGTWTAVVCSLAYRLAAGVTPPMLTDITRLAPVNCHGEGYPVCLPKWS